MTKKKIFITGDIASQIKMKEMIKNTKGIDENDMEIEFIDRANLLENVAVVEDETSFKEQLMEGLPISPNFDADMYYENFRYGHLTKKERNAVIVPVRTEPKYQRNSPCPCGSGLKYKNCCINKIN